MFTTSTTDASKTAPPTEAPASGRVSRFVAAACLIIYSVSNGLLSQMAVSAVRVTRRDYSPRWYECEDPAACHPSRGLLHVFILVAALVASLTCSLMATRLILRRKSDPAESSWVFRGLCFALLLFVPLLIIGWSSPAVALTIPTRSAGNGTQNDGPTVEPQFVGSIAGAFVIEAAVRSSPKSVQMATVMFHVNVIMGIVFAGIASALAPWMGCKTTGPV